VLLTGSEALYVLSVLSIGHTCNYALLSIPVKSFLFLKISKLNNRELFGTRTFLKKFGFYL
jgi:hypothetical protein